MLNPEGVQQRVDGEVARFHYGTRFDLPDRCDGDLGAGGELFLGQALPVTQLA